MHSKITTMSGSMSRSGGSHEFILGGVAAASAAFLTNPAEVVKTRFQLQGEKGNGSKPYRNFYQSVCAIAKHEGMTGLQRGVLASMAYQLVMNGARFGSYQLMVDRGAIHKADGSVSAARSLFCGALAGSFSAFMGNPLYLVKTRMQASSIAPQLAVGQQYQYSNFLVGLDAIYRRRGFLGLWRGAHASVVRVSVGSAAQLCMFSKSKDLFATYTGWSHSSHQVSFLGSLTSGLMVVTVMHPFDLVCTRIFNERSAMTDNGRQYKGVVACFREVLRNEGIRGFYSGFWAGYGRIAPHTFLCLFFWDELRLLYQRVSEL